MKVYRIILTAVLLCLLSVLLIASSLGWLTNTNKIEPPLFFTAGEAQPYTLYQITYNNEDAATDPGKQNKSAVDNPSTGLTARISRS